VEKTAAAVKWSKYPPLAPGRPGFQQAIVCKKEVIDSHRSQGSRRRQPDYIPNHARPMNIDYALPTKALAPRRFGPLTQRPSYTPGCNWPRFAYRMARRRL